jgi:hypothetical protein
MSSPIPTASYALPSGSFTESRVGTVVLATPNSLFVDVAGTTIEVAFVVPFTTGTVAPPAAGTVVQLIRQDSSWVALGRLVGAGSNSVLNGSFEASVPGSFPALWFSANISGVSTATVVDIPDAPEGDLAARVYSGQASVHYLYSSPIAVNSGEIWSLGAFVGGDYGGGAPTADAAIVATWFANATNLYPTTSSADIVVTTSVDVPQYPPFRSLFGNVTAPVSGYLRVALRSTLAAGQALIWDNCTARRV